MYIKIEYPRYLESREYRPAYCAGLNGGRRGAAADLSAVVPNGSDSTSESGVYQFNMNVNMNMEMNTSR